MTDEIFKAVVMLSQAAFGATIIGLLGAAALVYRSMFVFVVTIIGGAAAGSSYILYLFGFNEWALVAAVVSWVAPFLALLALIVDHTIP